MITHRFCFYLGSNIRSTWLRTTSLVKLQTGHLSLETWRFCFVTTDFLNCHTKQWLYHSIFTRVCHYILHFAHIHFSPPRSHHSPISSLQLLPVLLPVRLPFGFPVTNIPSLPVFPTSPKISSSSLTVSLLVFWSISTHTWMPTQINWHIIFNLDFACDRKHVSIFLSLVYFMWHNDSQLIHFPLDVMV